MECESDHEETEFQHPPHPTLGLSFQKEEKYDCYMLVIAQFGAPALFAHSLIGPLEVVNKLNFSKAKQSSLAELYLDTSQKTLFLIFNDEMPPMKEIYFSHFLEENIKSERIILLMSINKTTLHEPNCPALTRISTTALEEVVTLPHFPEGVTGIWADILAWGEIHRVSVCGFMASLKQYELTSELVDEAFGVLRGKYGLKGHFDIKERVRRYNIKRASNRLYC